MPATGVILLITIVAIVLVLVFYLLSTIVALRQITTGLDDVIQGVSEIIEKSAPVNEVVNTINADLDAGVELLEGLLVKKAGMVDAVGLGGQDAVLFFVAVQDVAATLERAEALGGKTIQPATEVPGVTFGVLSDAQGHVVGVAAN